MSPNNPPRERIQQQNEHTAPSEEMNGLAWNPFSQYRFLKINFSAPRGPLEASSCATKVDKLQILRAQHHNPLEMTYAFSDNEAGGCFKY